MTTPSASEGIAFSPPNLQSTLTTQRTAYLRDGPPSLAQRRDDLARLKAAVLARRGQMEEAVNADFGHRSVQETAIMEILPLVQGMAYQRRHLRRWMRPERRHVPLTFAPARAWVEWQPLGVVGIVSPWNYPFSLALMPLATALAAGNRVMLKPSELTPASSALLAELVGATFAPEQVAVCLGDAAVGQAFCSLPLDHLLFTGSTAVGRSVMRAASTNLTPVTLELGGKSPVIIERGHALQQAAEAIAYGKLANAGQTCIAPDYVLVHADDLPAFVAAFDAAVRALYPQGPNSAAYSCIINERHMARLQGLMADAQAQGAKVQAVGVHPEQASARPRTLAPTVLLGCSGAMRIMQEEIFGPLLPVLPYRTLDEAIAAVNARPRPLALYYFGRRGAGLDAVLARTTSGNVSVNATLMHCAQDDLPFGGVGESGMGAYHGIEGFKALSHGKGVYSQGAWAMSHLLRPPHGALAQRILKALLR